MSENDPASGPLILAAAPPSNGEQVPPNEAAAIASIVAAIKAGVAARAAADGTARRDAHAKAHGTVEAEFRVLDDLPAALRVGLFAEPRSYPALIRFSNGSGEIQADLVPDGRGMALKLLNVTGSVSTTHDFLMISHDAFFVRDAADYAEFSTVQPQAAFFMNLHNPRPHEAGIAAAIALHAPSDPLDVRYWSMAPLRFGDTECKVSARPAGPPSRFTERLGHDYMRDNMVRHLADSDASFDFMVQLRTRPDAMPIEDPTIEWNADDAPFVTVARITIPRQGFDTPERRNFGEALSFTPWHAIEEHRPLGGINRVRRAVYEAISIYRHQFNNAPRAEPASLPSMPPPAQMGQETTMANWFEREFYAHLGTFIEGDGWLTAEASKLAINTAVNSTRNRPHPWSTFADYPNWRGLSDRTYLARHLPPKYPTVALPDPATVIPLFARPAGSGGAVSAKSTCLFPAFAQYLTDGFIRTNPGDAKKNTSNHEIDLCPLYGRTPDQTNALRLNNEATDRKGRLKSQLIGTEEFPPFLYDMNGKITDAAFNVLDVPLFDFRQELKDPLIPAPPPPTGPDWPPERGASLFAVGGDRVNSTPFSAMMNTVWLREHNRVALRLERDNNGWDDERVFQTARNIVIPMFIKVVVEDYINHIAPLPFKIRADPSVVWDATWNRPNWMTAEFSLLYRWHSLMPDVIQWPVGGPIPLEKFTLDNRALIASGLNGAITAAATQSSNELGALNTSNTLMPIEMLSILQARSNHFDNYNAYRVAFGMRPATEFSEISGDRTIQALLQQIYGTVDQVEFYPGLFAEDRVPDSPLPQLLMTMVAVDAFSQALTNPLLSQHVWKDNPTLTFTDWGFGEIAATSTLADVLKRQGRPDTAPAATMTTPGWTYAGDR
jgi:prostaglandin-endoperoxide synthase 2